MNLKRIYKITEKMDESDFYFLLESLENKENKDIIENLKKNFSYRNLKMYTNNNENIDWLNFIYKEEIQDLLFIMNNDQLIKNTKGIKILLYGETGTGKTTLVNKLINVNPAYNKKDIDWELIIDPKMGQTQINLLKLSKEVQDISTKTIIFLDEIDSFATNRTTSNDLGEYSRIVGSFIKFMDNLPENIIFIAATNLVDKLDQAILRRFNIKLESKYLSFEKVIEIFNIESMEFVISKQEENLLKSLLIDNKFTFSELESFLFNFQIDYSRNRIKHNWAYFIKRFNKKFEDIEILIKNNMLSDRKKREIREEFK